MKVCERCGANDIENPEHEVDVDLGQMDKDGGLMFKLQRSILTKMIEGEPISAGERELMYGLQNLCDKIADELHDRYGLDTLWSSEGDGTHMKVQYGQCAICGHHGDDCSGVPCS